MVNTGIRMPIATLTSVWSLLEDESDIEVGLVEVIRGCELLVDGCGKAGEVELVLVDLAAGMKELRIDVLPLDLVVFWIWMSDVGTISAPPLVQVVIPIEEMKLDSAFRRCSALSNETVGSEIVNLLDTNVSAPLVVAHVPFVTEVEIIESASNTRNPISLDLHLKTNVSRFVRHTDGFLTYWV